MTNRIYSLITFCNYK